MTFQWGKSQQLLQQDHSLTRLPPPAMHILFYLHIPKTGGSSLNTWVQKLLPVRHYSYTKCECFLCDPYHAHLFQPICRKFNTSHHCTLWQPRQPPLGRNASVFVEFHSSRIGLFYHRVVPQIPALRALHAGGSVRSMTLLRDPRLTVLSHYAMWPPPDPRIGPVCTPGNNGQPSRCMDTSLLGLNRYLSAGHLHGIQTFWLEKPLSNEQAGTSRRTCASEAAARRLSTFDQVANISTFNLSWVLESMQLLPDGAFRTQVRLCQTIESTFPSPRYRRASIGRGGLWRGPGNKSPRALPAAGS